MFKIAKSFNIGGEFMAKLTNVKIKHRVANTANRLIKVTPVLTGYTRGSWYVSPNIPVRVNKIKRSKTAVRLGVVVVPKPIITLLKYDRQYKTWHIVNLSEAIEKLEREGSRTNSPGWINNVLSNLNF